MKKKYWETTQIDKTEAEYRIPIGERGNGKSYAVKKKSLLLALQNNEEFIYLRRFREDIKTVYVERYFADMDIKKLTHGVYDGIYVYHGEIYYCNYNDDGKAVNKKLIGHACALSEDERLKSQQFPDVTNIIYEEFVSKRMYLPDEPNRLQNFVSTVARDRQIAVWMIGNKMTRVCPYFQEWGLTNIPKQKMGTIEVYRLKSYDDEGNEKITRVAVENCGTSGSKSTMFFGKSASAIKNGEWETDSYPKFPAGEMKDYTRLYELMLSDLGFDFVLQLYVQNETGGMFVYVYPYTRNRIIKRKITNIFSPDPLTTSTFNDNINAERIIRDCLQKSKTCYSDNLTGTDFNQVLKSRKGLL